MKKSNIIMNNKKYIDLHLHSFHSKKNGDAIDWLDELSTLIKLRNKEIKAFSITDHDCFSFSLYQNFKKLIKEYKFDIILFPGSEITIKRKNEKRAHILFIFDNQTSDSMLNELEMIIHKHYQTNGTNLSNFIKELRDKNYNFTMIPHVGKCDSVSYEDVEEIINEISYVESPILKPEFSRFINQANKKIKAIMFSDTHVWSTYAGSKVYTLSNHIVFDDLKNNLNYEED